MTLADWSAAQSGTCLKIPAGTVIGHAHWYRYPLDHPTHPGAWSTDTAAWKVKIAHEYRAIVTDRDQFIEIHIDRSGLEEMARRATSNRGGKSVDGPLTIKHVRSRR